MSFQALEAPGGQAVLVAQWAEWEVEVVTGVAAALPQEDRGGPEETLPVEETSSTEQETGSAPTRKSLCFISPLSLSSPPRYLCAVLLM